MNRVEASIHEQALKLKKELDDPSLIAASMAWLNNADARQVLSAWFQNLEHCSKG
jgi:hypothetical protein